MPAIRRLVPGDEEWLDGYLARHAATSLFLRSNLRRAGLIDSGERFQGRYAALIGDDQAIHGIVAHSWNGNLLIQAPPDVAIELSRHLSAYGDRPVTGLIGPLAAVRAVQTAFPELTLLKDSAEDLFELRLDGLQVPASLSDGALSWRRAAASDLPWLAEWRSAYCVETLGAVDDAALAVQAARDVADWTHAGDVFVLVDKDGSLQSMATHNARIPDTVQIGGVWTPPALRGRGFARAVVAGALLAARAQGAETALLFTGRQNEPARRAYLSLGRTIIGDYAIVLFA